MFCAEVFINRTVRELCFFWGEILLEDLPSVAIMLLQREIIVGRWPLQKAFDFSLLLISIKNNKLPIFKKGLVWLGGGSARL